MKHLVPTGLALFLLAIAGGRVWARRSLALLSCEERMRALEASVRGNIWPFVALAVALLMIHWLPTDWIPSYYGPGLFTLYMVLPFFVSLGAGLGLWMRLSRSGLPQPYIWRVRFQTIAFHLALLLLIFVIVLDAYLNISRVPAQP